MVFGQANKDKAVSRPDVESTVLMVVLLAILVATTTLILYYLIVGLQKNDISIAEDIGINKTGEGAYVSSENTEVKPEKIDFQPVVDEWVESAGGNKSVLIYDLDRDEVVGSYNAEENYDTASLYKLFVVYEGYRRLESGEWQADELVDNTGRNILECLDLAIRESHSECAETLWTGIGHIELDEIIERDFGIKNSDISALTSNPEDIMKIMKLFYKHPDIEEETLVTRMKDSFLNQPKTEYNWRQGLPSGFSGKANVYNKVGWDFNNDENYWNIYHDAAIVEFPEKDRYFIVVVMTYGTPYQQIRKFGSMMEAEFNKY